MFRVPRRAPSFATTSTSLEDDEGVDTPQPSEAMPPPTQAPLRRPSTRPALLPNASLDDGAFTVSDLDESSACVVVVSPVAARRNAASAAYSPRHRRPPTPVEGDGFPSVADDPNSMLANSSNAVDTGGSSGGRPDDDSGAGRVGRHPRYYYQPEMSGKLALALMGGAALLLLVLVLAYNTELEQNLIRRARSLLTRAVSGNRFRRGRAPHDANNTHDAAVANDGASAPSLAKPSASPPESAPLPEDPEEFEHRLRQMVSRFWVPFLAVTSPPVQARERRRDDLSGGKRDEDYRDDDDDVTATSPPEESLPPHALESPFKRPRGRDNWFLVQARRRHGALGSPHANRTDDDQLWQEDTDDVGRLWDDLR